MEKPRVRPLDVVQTTCLYFRNRLRREPFTTRRRRMIENEGRPCNLRTFGGLGSRIQRLPRSFDFSSLLLTFETSRAWPYNFHPVLSIKIYRARAIFRLAPPFANAIFSQTFHFGRRRRLFDDLTRGIWGKMAPWRMFFVRFAFF